jgi:hypothetical protein
MQAAHEHESGPVALMIGVDHHPQDGAPVPGEGAATVHEQPHPDHPLPITKDAERIVTGSDAGERRIKGRGHLGDRRGRGEPDTASGVRHGYPGGEDVRPQPCVERVGGPHLGEGQGHGTSLIANILQ